MANRTGTSLATGITMLVVAAVIIDSVFTGRKPWEVAMAVIRGENPPSPKAAASTGVAPSTSASGTPITFNPNGIGVSAKGIAAAAWAATQLGKPYKVGPGRFGPDYYDCSGLVYAAFRSVGINIATITYDQVKQGINIPVDPNYVKPGDLIFKQGDVPSRMYGHVAIAINSTQEIQAPHTGDVVKITPIPYADVQAIRRVA